MKSIRNRLLFWLLSGVVILLTVVGGGIFFTARYILISQVDDELQVARKVVYNSFENGVLKPGAFLKGAPREQRLRLRDEAQWREFDYQDGNLLYQLKVPEGDVFLRSPSLGKRTIYRPDEIPDPRKSVSLALPDGVRLRARIDYANPKKWPDGFEIKTDRPEAGIEIIVARDVSGIERTLSLLLAGLLIASFVATGATALLVSWALHRGLSPLSRLGEEASKVDANTLTTRFDDTKMPRELLPICDRLNSLMARLENSFERERRFSSDLAHELRTPIAELSSMAEASVLFPEKVPQDQFEKIVATAREMQRMVESLLSLARWEQGRSELNLEEIDVSEAVEECWTPFLPTAVEKELTVTVALRPGHLLKADTDLLHHILNNLFSNAVEYTPRGGQVQIEPIAGPNGLPTGLAVSNSVEQLDASEVSHLFERFWRQDPSRSGSDHSGLGLSVARACAEVLSLKLTAKLEDGLIRFELSG